MEGLAPPLKCLIEIQSALRNGETVRKGVAQYLQSATHGDSFARDTRRFFFAWDQGQDWKTAIAGISSSHRRALLELVSSSLGGHPIIAHLEELRAEIESACESEIERHIELLPIKMLLPLLLFQFPAFLVLLFGPLLARLLAELSR